MQTPRAVKLREITEADAEEQGMTILDVEPTRPVDGILIRKEGGPALCCARCAATLARRVDTATFAGLVLRCGACGGLSIID